MKKYGTTEGATLETLEEEVSVEETEEVDSDTEEGKDDEE